MRTAQTRRAETRRAKVRFVRRRTAARPMTSETGAARASATLSNVVIVFESESAARRRLEAFGYSPEIADEIAVYLAQSTDLPLFVDDIATALGKNGLRTEFVELEGLAARLQELAPERDRTIVWAVTDGMRFYRGSSIPALVRLMGFARFGSPPSSAHICQDKFASLALASAAGLAIPPTRLFEGEKEIAALGEWPSPSDHLFVKPNTLGSKIGIFADSLCRDRTEAIEGAKRIWERYHDRALVQPFIEGDDVRASFMDLGGEFSDQLGVERIVKDAVSEAGGAFLTMKDNETLSGARDTSGGRGGFGVRKSAAFTPHMVNLRTEQDERSRRAVAQIVDACARLSRLLGLRNYFSVDFRIGSGGQPIFLEFEICPAVTIYDFQSYLQSQRGRSLGEALVEAMRLAYSQREAMDEA